jgi:putative ABC transport system ATP-binding protein
MITTKGVEFQYNKENTLVFGDINLQKNESLLILGKSGVGKTTFLHLLGLLLKPAKGEIIINSIITNTLSNSNLVKFRAQNIGIVYQKPHFVSALTVKENLTLATYLAGKKEQLEHLHLLAQSLDIERLLNKNIRNLSLGEQQRVGIARALINSPSIILADEPSSSLDDENCKKMIDLLKMEAEKIEANLIIVTHDSRLKSVFENQISLTKN